MNNIIPFRPPGTSTILTQQCRACNGKGVEGMRIGRMYSEITCRVCKGSGETKITKP
jgi:DnaJ-class molecular chaperone